MRKNVLHLKTKNFQLCLKNNFIYEACCRHNESCFHKKSLEKLFEAVTYEFLSHVIRLRPKPELKGKTTKAWYEILTWSVFVPLWSSKITILEVFEFPRKSTPPIQFKWMGIHKVGTHRKKWQNLLFLWNEKPQNNNLINEVCLIVN